MKKLKGNLAQGVREETRNGRKVLIVPCVMSVVGVHTGMDGIPTYYPAEALQALAAVANGAPVMVNHPVDSTGQPVSANNSVIRWQSGIGEIENPRFEDDKLKADLIIDISKAQAIVPDALQRMRQGDRVEVSSCPFGSFAQQPGVWNNEHYAEVATANMISMDHLAILPEDVGACSWQDGCGVRAAQSDKNHTETTMPKAFEWLMNAARKLMPNEVGNNQVREKLRNFVNALDTPEYINYYVDHFDEYFVYETAKRDMMTGISTISKFYKRSFSVNQETGEVTVADDTVEVIEKREYVEVEQRPNAEPANDLPPKVNTDKSCTCKEKSNMEKTALVDKLIACERTRWTAEDRDFLMSQEIKALEKFQAPDEKAPEPAKEPETKANEAPKTTEEALALMPEPIRTSIKALVARDESEKADLVKKILAIKTNQFTEADLKAMDRENLNRIAALAAIPVDYSGAAPAAPVEEANPLPLMPSTGPVKK